MSDSLCAGRKLILHQKPYCKGRYTFELRTDGTLAVTYRTWFHSEMILCDLAGFAAHPVRERHRAVGWIAGLCILAVPALALAWGAVAVRHDAMGLLMCLCLLPVALALCLLCWYGYHRNSYDIVAFLDQYTGTRAILHHGLPAQQECEAFVTALQDAIQTARATTQQATLAGELEHLGRAHRTGVISDEEFAQAKQAVLDRYQRREIGFHI